MNFRVFLGLPKEVQVEPRNICEDTLFWRLIGPLGEIYLSEQWRYTVGFEWRLIGSFKLASQGVDQIFTDES